MKLKKIASLALAGVMAVSMLAGCAGKTGTTDDGTTVVVTNGSIAAQAFNDGQDADNKVKVTFTADSKLESNLALAVKKLGEDATWSTIEDELEKLTGKTSQTLAASDSGAKDGESLTQWYGFVGDSVKYWTLTDAVNAAARDADKTIANLKATTNDDNKADGDKYFDFSYTGTVAVVSTVDVDGTTNYYVAYTITQTAAEQTKTKG